MREERHGGSLIEGSFIVLPIIIVVLLAISFMCTSVGYLGTTAAIQSYTNEQTAKMASGKEVKKMTKEEFMKGLEKRMTEVPFNQFVSLSYVKPVIYDNTRVEGEMKLTEVRADVYTRIKINPAGALLGMKQFTISKKELFSSYALATVENAND